MVSLAFLWGMIQKYHLPHLTQSKQEREIHAGRLELWGSKKAWSGWEFSQTGYFQTLNFGA
jgi:hypothetical protein